MELRVGRSTHPWWTRVHVLLFAWLGTWAVLSGLGDYDAPRRGVALSAAFAYVFAWPVAAAAFRRGAWCHVLAASGALVSIHRPRGVEALVTTLIFVPFLGLFSSLLLAPLMRFAWSWRAAPRLRSVAYECALLGVYGCFATSAAGEGLHPTTRMLARPVGLATIVVCIVGLAWDLSARAQIRDVLAGRLPGWRAVATAEADAPRIRWLGPFDPKSARVLLRVDGAGSAYREAPARETAIAWIPGYVPRVGPAGITCALLACASVWWMITR